MNFRRSRPAVGMVEYSLIGALVALALVIILALVGTGVIGVFQNVINGLTGNGSAPTSLVVNINNLDFATPGDISATPSVTVSGPGGFTQALTSSTTLPNLLAGTYTVIANPVVATVPNYSVPVTFYPTVTPASVTIPSSSHTITVDYVNTEPASTHAVTGADLALLTSTTGDSINGYTLVFSAAPSFAPFVVNDVLIVDPSSADPNGLLVKITHVNANTIDASAATLSDAYGRVNFTSSTSPVSQSFTTPALSSLSPKSIVPNDLPLFQIGCGSNLIWPTGTFNTNLNFVFTLQLNWPGLDQSQDKFGITVNATEIYHIQFNYYSLEVPPSVALFCQVAFPALGDFIEGEEPMPAPIPGTLWMVPELTLNATVQLQLYPSASPWFTLDGTASVSLGFLCDHTGCHFSHNLSFPSPVHSTNGVGDILVKFGPRINMKINDLVGPYVAAYGYDQFTTVPNMAPDCMNDQIGLEISGGGTLGVGAVPALNNLWSLQLLSVDLPLHCFVPPLTPSDPSVITGAIDPRGCPNTSNVLGIYTPGCGNQADATGPGQIQFNVDNSQPRGTIESEVTGTLHFPQTLATSINNPSSCIDPNNPVPSNCVFNLLVSGRTWSYLDGGQIGRWEVDDSDGWVYTNTAQGCSGESNNGTFPCNDIVLFGTGNAGYIGPGAISPNGCGGNECVDGGQLSANCKSASGVNESCAGHTLIIHIWIESGGKADYSGGGSQNYPEQPIGWFDGVSMSSDHSGGNGLNGSNNFIFAAGNDPVWHCSPASTNLTYIGQACPG